MSTRYRKRAFLNRDRSKRAYTIAHVDKISNWESGRSNEIYADMGATLEIGDCSRTIYLDFSIASPREKANVLFKARLLRQIVNTFLDEVEAEAGKSDFKPKKKKVDEKTKDGSKKGVGDKRLAAVPEAGDPSRSTGAVGDPVL